VWALTTATLALSQIRDSAWFFTAPSDSIANNSPMKRPRKTCRSNVQVAWFRHEKVKSDSGKTDMLTQNLYKFVCSSVAMSGLILIVTLSGCSLPGTKTAPQTVLSNNYPYQSNYRPTGQFQPYAPTYNYPTGQWNQAGFPVATPQGQVQSFNPLGFTGQTC
jgi:hypothetical protein